MTIAPIDDSRPWPEPFPANTRSVTLSWPPGAPGLDIVDHMTLVEGHGPAAVRRASPTHPGWTEVEYLCYAAMFAHVALVKEYRRRLDAVTPTSTPAAEPARLVPLRTTAHGAARLQRQAQAGQQVELW